jgi:hypothetical protein
MSYSLNHQNLGICSIDIKLVKSFEGIDDSNNELDVSELNIGMYLIKVNGEGVNEVIRWVKN